MKIRLHEGPRRARGPAPALLAAASLLLAACDFAPPLELARIDRLSPGVLEPGDVLRIEGSGFVEGPAPVTLEGEFKTRGLYEPERRRVVLDGNAVNEILIEVPIGVTAMARLASEPTDFEGAVSIRFPSAVPDSPVRVEASARGVELDIRPAGGGVASEARRLRRAELLLDLAGLSLPERAGGDQLLVAGVAEGGPAGAAGFRPGDRVLAVDGTAIASLADLAGLDMEEAHRFEVVSSDGELREISLELAAVSPLDRDELVALLLTSTAIGLFLALGAPTRRRLDVWRPEVGGHFVASALGLGLASVPVLLFPAVAIVGHLEISATLFLVCAHAVGLSAAALYAGGNPLRRIAGLAAHAAPILSLLALTGLAGSPIGLGDAIADRGSGDWGWHAVSSPFALAAVVAAIALLWPRFSEKGAAAPRVVRIGSWTAALAASMLASSIALGGWLVPGAAAADLSSRPDLLLAAVAVFAVKSWVVLLAARWLADAGSAERRGAARRGGVAPAALALLAATGLAAAWSIWGAPEEIRAAGRILATAVLAAIATAFAARRLLSLLPRRGPTPTAAPERN